MSILLHFACTIAPMVELESQPTNRNNELMAELERRKKVNFIGLISLWLRVIAIDKICGGSSGWSWGEERLKSTWAASL